MPQPDFERLEALFHHAVDLPPAEQAAFLDGECAGNVELRTALEKMLRHDLEDPTVDGLLASPVARVASELRHDAPTLPAPPPAGANPSRAILPEVPGYVLLEELGRGGMGVVYKARQTGLNRLVALKMLLPFAAPKSEQLARFRTEAEALARLSHPNVIPIYEVGECAAGPYFSMEYVAGPSLAGYVDGRPCDPASSAHLVEVLARAIDAVHHCGIVHRDLKPANILLAPRREVVAACETLSGGRVSLSAYDPKITDFGLAKDRAALRALTLSGTMLGTPCYMAPEQAGGRGDRIGPATDVYSLGAILYEMLTGRPPFEGVTPAETIARVIADEPLPPSRLRAGLPRDLVTVCMKCLEKSRRRRYTTALELADDLGRFLAGEPIHARPTGPIGRAYRWCRRRPLVAALVTLCGALLLAFSITVLVYDVKLRAALNQARSSTEEERQEIVRLNVTIGLSEAEDGDTFSAILHFSEALRLDAGAPERERSHRTRIATALRQSPRLNRLLIPGGELLCARLSGSGGHVATVGADHVVQVWDVMTGVAMGPALRHDEAVRVASLSPDGKVLATVGSGRMVRAWNLTDGTARILERGRAEISSLSFGKGGRFLMGRGDGPEVITWDLSGDEPEKLTHAVPHGSARSLSEDGTRALTVDSDGVRVWDLNTGSALGRPLQWGNGLAEAVLSPDGRRIACLGTDNRIRIGEPGTGKWLANPLLPHFPVQSVLFSPDAEKLFTAGKGNVAIVWKVSTGELLATLAHGSGSITFARFSPDARLLVTGDNVHGARVWDAQSGRPLTPPLRHGGELCAASFTADCRQLVTAGKQGALCVWDLPPDAESGGSGPVVRDEGRRGASSPTTTNRLVEEGVVRPDGRRLSVRATGRGIRVYDAATGEPASPILPHATAVRFAVFNADGTRLVTSDDDDTARVWDVATGAALAPSKVISGTLTGVRFDESGERAIFTNSGGRERIWDLGPDQRPVEDLVRLARVLAYGWIDDEQNRQFFDAPGLKAAWQSLNGSPEARK